MARERRARRESGVTAVVAPAARADRQKIAAADFYSAVQRALDGLQRQLSSANNDFADFVVKELKIDAAVQLDMSALGVLQFVLADDAMAAHSVSRVSVTLAAVAKSQTDPSFDFARADATPLADLGWVPLEAVQQLARHEVKTVSEFLGLAADARLSTRIGSVVKAEQGEIRRWTDRMRLLTLRGMTVPIIHALDKFGIQSMAQLAQLGDDALAELPRAMGGIVSTELLTQWRNTAALFFRHGVHP